MSLPLYFNLTISGTNESCVNMLLKCSISSMRYGDLSFEFKIGANFNVTDFVERFPYQVASLFMQCDVHGVWKNHYTFIHKDAVIKEEEKKTDRKPKIGEMLKEKLNVSVKAKEAKFWEFIEANINVQTPGEWGLPISIRLIQELSPVLVMKDGSNTELTDEFIALMKSQNIKVSAGHFADGPCVWLDTDEQ